MARNPNRGIVLRLSDAAAIHRMLELWMDGRKFDNPIVAYETKRDAEAAKERLGEKMMAVFLAHQALDDDDEAVGEAQGVQVSTD